MNSIPYKGFEIVFHESDGWFSYTVNKDGVECISMSEDFEDFASAKKAAKKHVTRGLVFMEGRSSRRNSYSYMSGYSWISPHESSKIQKLVRGKDERGMIDQDKDGRWHAFADDSYGKEVGYKIFGTEDEAKHYVESFLDGYVRNSKAKGRSAMRRIGHNLSQRVKDELDALSTEELRKFVSNIDNSAAAGANIGSIMEAKRQYAIKIVTQRDGFLYRDDRTSLSAMRRRSAGAQWRHQRSLGTDVWDLIVDSSGGSYRKGRVVLLDGGWKAIVMHDNNGGVMATIDGLPSIERAQEWVSDISGIRVSRRAMRNSRVKTSNSSVAEVIKQQIGMNTLMSLGAHNFMYTSEGNGGLVFNAKILPFNANGKRGSGARVMQVQVILNDRDLYDIKVGFLKSYNWVDHYSAYDVYADNISNIMLALDYDGDTVLNPRYADVKTSGRLMRRKSSNWTTGPDHDTGGVVHYYEKGGFSAEVFGVDSSFPHDDSELHFWSVYDSSGNLVAEGEDPLGFAQNAVEQEIDYLIGQKTSQYAPSRKQVADEAIEVIKSFGNEEFHFLAVQRLLKDRGLDVHTYGVGYAMEDLVSMGLITPVDGVDASQATKFRKSSRRTSSNHLVSVEFRRENNHGYPWVATCSCGWESWGYVAEHAAQMMADDHAQNAGKALARRQTLGRRKRSFGNERFRLTNDNGEVIEGSAWELGEMGYWEWADYDDEGEYGHLWDALNAGDMHWANEISRNLGIRVEEIS